MNSWSTDILAELGSWTPKWQKVIERFFEGSYPVQIPSVTDDYLTVPFGEPKQPQRIAVVFARTEGNSHSILKRHLVLVRSSPSGQEDATVRHVRYFQPSLGGVLAGTKGFDHFGDDLLELQYRAYTLGSRHAAVSAAARGAVTGAFLRTQASGYPHNTVMWQLLMQVAADVERGKDLQAYAVGGLDPLLTGRFLEGV